MSKFYAVKVGKIPGIYNSWGECQKQINKFPCASYKSFKTLEEAKKFIEVKKPIIKDDAIHIYTDGSHTRPNKKREIDFRGFGIWCKHKNVEYKIAGQSSPELLDYYKIRKYADDLSNPSMEMLGVAETLRRFGGDNKNCKFSSDENNQIVFHCDYVGSANWIDGTWAAKEPYIILILEKCKEFLSSMKCEVVFEHVKGHSGVAGNTAADLLAGSEEEYDNFGLLLDVLNE